jgi:hypothetical protein
MKCPRCKTKMEIKNDKKKDGDLQYSEYYWKCDKCSCEQIDGISSLRTAQSLIRAKKQARKI